MIRKPELVLPQAPGLRRETLPVLGPLLPEEARRDPFLERMEKMVVAWLLDEWLTKEAIKTQAGVHGWTAQLKNAYNEACLTPDNLARRLDNISLSKLRRELGKQDIPTPGDIIRTARIEYAKHLLTHSRMLIREVAERAGYTNEKHFARIFIKAAGIAPSEYRRSALLRKA